VSDFGTIPEATKIVWSNQLREAMLRSYFCMPAGPPPTRAERARMAVRRAVWRVRDAWRVLIGKAEVD
jgi:hypothetical protein